MVPVGYDQACLKPIVIDLMFGHIRYASSSCTCLDGFQLMWSIRDTLFYYSEFCDRGLSSSAPLASKSRATHTFELEGKGSRINY